MDFKEFAKEYKDDVCFHFDDDGVIHEWKQLSLSIPAYYNDMTEEEKRKWEHDEIYKTLLSPNYFKNLAVMPKAVELANKLHEAGFMVRVLSCSINKDTDRQKYESLQEALPWLTKEDITLIPDGMGSKKYDYIPESIKHLDHILIDDHTPNCVGFCDRGGMALKYLNGINGKNGTWKGLTAGSDIDKSLDALAECLSYGMGKECEEYER